MNPKRFTMICAVCLVFGGIAAAQQPANLFAQSATDRSGGGGSQTEPNAATYEDVEIMRRILARAAQALENGNASVSGHVDRYGFFRGQVPPGMVATPTMVPLRNGDVWSGSAMGGGIGAQSGSSAMGGGIGSITGYVVQPLPGQRAGELHVEGGYLKGYGVVYTVTLPPRLWPNQHAASAPGRTAAVDRPSLWEEVRSELHGDAPQAPPAVTRETPRTDDVLLRALFDNGGNFRHLGERENLALIVTFPPRGENVSSTRTTFGMAAGPASPYVTTVENELETAASNERNSELLGDLHLKQGRIDDAIKAYRKAAEGGKASAELSTKLAQAYLAARDLEAAREALNEAERASKQSPAQTMDRRGNAGAVALPATLTISVSGETLAQVAAGKLDFDGFKKQVSIDYVGAPRSK